MSAEVESTLLHMLKRNEEHEFFKEKPHLDCPSNRILFVAGFLRGAIAFATSPNQPPQPQK